MSINENSLEWKIVSEYLEDRLQYLREKNDKQLPMECTAALRGQILEVKKLMKLPSMENKPETKTVSY